MPILPRSKFQRFFSMYDLAVFMLVGAAVTGKLSLSDLSGGVLPALELRFVGMALSAFLLAASTDFKVAVLNSFICARRAAFGLLALMCVFAAGFFLRDTLSAGLSFEAGSLAVYDDILAVFLQFALALALLRNVEDVATFMRFLCLFAILAAVVAIARILYTTGSIASGPWSLSGGPSNGFCAIQLGGFAAALFGLLRAKNAKESFWQFALVVFFMMAAFFSLQKVAQLTIFIAVVVCCFALVVLRHYRIAILVVAGLVCAYTIFSPVSQKFRLTHAYVSVVPQARFEYMEQQNKEFDLTRAPADSARGVVEAASSAPNPQKTAAYYTDYIDTPLPEGLDAYELSLIGWELRPCYLEAYRLMPDEAVLKDLDETSCSDSLNIHDGTTRVRLVRKALALIKAAPLLGGGVDSYRFITVRGKEFSVHTYPHNIVLSLLVSFGFVGAAIFTLPWLVAAVLLLRRLYAFPESVGVLGLGMVVAITSLVSGDIYEARFLWLLLPLTLALTPAARRDELRLA